MRGWLSGVIDDMRRSSPVQQWLDSLPAEVPDDIEKPEAELKSIEHKSDEKIESKHDESVTDNTVVDLNGDDKTLVETREQVQDDKNLEVPESKDVCKRKSLESGMLSGNARSGPVKRLQRDHSVQSEGCSPRFKNPLFRDHSLQVNLLNTSTNFKDMTRIVDLMIFASFITCYTSLVDPALHVLDILNCSALNDSLFYYLTY